MKNHKNSYMLAELLDHYYEFDEESRIKQTKVFAGKLLSLEPNLKPMIYTFLATSIKLNKERIDMLNDINKKNKMGYPLIENENTNVESLSDDELKTINAICKKFISKQTDANKIALFRFLALTLSFDIPKGDSIFTSKALELVDYFLGTYLKENLTDPEMPKYAHYDRFKPYVCLVNHLGIKYGNENNTQQVEENSFNIKPIIHTISEVLPNSEVVLVKFSDNTQLEYSTWIKVNVGDLVLVSGKKYGEKGRIVKTNIKNYSFDEMQYVLEVFHDENSFDELFNSKSSTRNYLGFTLDKNKPFILKKDNSQLKRIITPGNIDDIIISKIGDNCFNSNRKKNIQEITIPKTIIEIGKHAFEYSAFDEIKIPDSVLHIEQGAFYRSFRLRKFVSPNNLYIISKELFSDCSSLEYVELKNVLEINENAFSSCKSLKEIKFSKNLKRIASGAFMNSGIERIQIPSSVSEIGGNLVTGCKKLKEITFENNCTCLKTIKTYTFSDILVEEIVLPEGLEKIEKNSFADCSMLKKVVFPKTLKEIDGNPFDNCPNIKEIYIPASVEKINFAGFNDIKIIIDSENKYIKNINGNVYNMSGDTLLLSYDGLIDDHVKVIAPYSLSNVHIKKLSIPYGVKLIDSNAFRQNINIESVNIPSSVIEIGKEAFSYCQNLKEITLPNSITKIGECAFEWCNLTSIKIPGSVKIVEAYTFAYNKLKEVILEEGIKEINYNAFASCYELLKIYIPNSVIEIDSSAFMASTKIEEVELNGNKYFIRDDNKIINAKTKETIININSYNKETTLTKQNIEYVDKDEIIIPAKIEEIYENTFSSFEKLRRVSFEAGSKIKRIGRYAFSNCVGLENIDFSNATNLTYIDESAFFKCTNLKKVIMPVNLTCVNSNLFYGCSKLESIELFDKVESVSNSAFDDCTHFKEIIYNGDQKDWEKISNIFKYTATIKGEKKPIQKWGKVMPVEFKDGTFDIRVITKDSDLTEILHSNIFYTDEIDAMILASEKDEHKKPRAHVDIRLENYCDYDIDYDDLRDTNYTDYSISEIHEAITKLCDTYESLHMERDFEGDYDESKIPTVKYVSMYFGNVEEDGLDCREIYICKAKDSYHKVLDIDRINNAFPLLDAIFGFYYQYKDEIYYLFYRLSEEIRMWSDRYLIQNMNMKLDDVEKGENNNQQPPSSNGQKPVQEKKQINELTDINYLDVTIQGKVVKTEDEKESLEDSNEDLFDNIEEETDILDEDKTSVEFKDCFYDVKVIKTDEEFNKILSSGVFWQDELINIDVASCDQEENSSTNFYSSEISYYPPQPDDEYNDLFIEDFNVAINKLTGKNDSLIGDFFEDIDSSIKVIGKAFVFTDEYYSFNNYMFILPTKDNSYKTIKSINTKAIMPIVDGDLTYSFYYEYNGDTFLLLYYRADHMYEYDDALKEIIAEYGFGGENSTSNETPTSATTSFNKSSSQKQISDFEENDILDSIQAKNTIENDASTNKNVADTLTKDDIIDKSITEYKVPENIKSIEKNTFEGCNNLKRVTLPPNLEAIWHYAFANLTQLQEIVFPKKLKEILGNAFEGCTGLKRIIFEEGSELDSILPRAFKDCTSLEKIVFPDGINLVDLSAFEGCTNLSEVTIPTSVRFGRDVFKLCPNLKRIIFRGTKEKWDELALRVPKRPEVIFENIDFIPKEEIDNSKPVNNNSYVPTYQNNFAKLDEEEAVLTGRRPETQPTVNKVQTTKPANGTPFEKHASNPLVKARKMCKVGIVLSSVTIGLMVISLFASFVAGLSNGFSYFVIIVAIIVAIVSIVSQHSNWPYFVICYISGVLLFINEVVLTNDTSKVTIPILVVSFISGIGMYTLIASGIMYTIKFGILKKYNL